MDDAERRLVGGLLVDEAGRWWDCSKGDHTTCPWQPEWHITCGCECHQEDTNTP